MKPHVIYCSACDREVTVLTTSDGPDNESLTGAICTELGKSCTDTLCPICASAPQAEMKGQSSNASGVS